MISLDLPGRTRKRENRGKRQRGCARRRRRHRSCEVDCSGSVHAAPRRPRKKREELKPPESLKSRFSARNGQKLSSYIAGAV